MKTIDTIRFYPIHKLLEDAKIKAISKHAAKMYSESKERKHNGNFYSEKEVIADIVANNMRFSINGNDVETVKKLVSEI